MDNRDRDNEFSIEGAQVAEAAVVADLLHEPDIESALEIEQHGFDFIPEKGRYLRPRELFGFWVGSNAYIVYMFIGALLLNLGLSLVQAAIALVLGFLGFMLIGYASIGGARSGLPTMTLTRAAFGVRGNRVNTLLAWLELIAFEALNAIFGVFAVLALSRELGWGSPGDVGYVIATVLVIGISALVAIYGHRLLFAAQRVFAIGLTAVLVLVAALTIGKVNWSHGASVHGSAALGLFLVAIALAAANPLSFVPTCADYPRYLPTNTPARQVTWWTFAGAGSITIFLGLLGVVLATKVNLVADPVGGMKPLIPTWLFVPFAIAAAGGSIANNAITFYSSGLTIQAIGLPLRRWRATLVDCVVSTAIVLYILLFNQSLSTTMSNFLAFLNVWVGPFGAVWVVDGMLRRWHYDPAGIHRIAPDSPYWGTGGFNIRGLASMAVGIVVGLLTINATYFQGPISRLLWNGDLAWVAPAIASGVVYWLLARRDLQSGMSDAR